MTTGAKQAFRREPEPRAETEQNHDILLACEVQFPALVGHVVWQKDDRLPIYLSTRDSPQTLEPDFFQMDGEPTRGEFNLNLRKARLEDSGAYECQVHAKVDDGKYIKATTHLVVKKQSDNQEPEAPPESNAKANSLQARDITSSALPPGKLLSKLVQQQQQQLQQQQQQQAAHSQIFLKPHASTAPSSAANLEAPSSSSYLLAHLNLHWPYLILLAFILLIANVYLFVNLFRRHRRNREALNKPNLAASSSGGSSTTTNISTVNNNNNNNTGNAATSPMTANNQLTTTDGYLAASDSSGESADSNGGSCSAATATSQLQCTLAADLSTCDHLDGLYGHHSSSLPAHHLHQHQQPFQHLQSANHQTLYVPALLRFQHNQQQHHQQYQLQQQQQQHQQHQPIQLQQPMSPSALHPWVLEI